MPRWTSWRRKRRGFTLIELMIVVIIVGILASVAMVLMHTNAERAKASEGVAALGTIRTAMRLYHTENGTYAHASFIDGAQVTAGNTLDVIDVDLLGHYFSTECYTFDGAPDATTYSIKCDGAQSTAIMGSEASGIVRYIDENGEVTKG